VLSQPNLLLSQISLINKLRAPWPNWSTTNDFNDFNSRSRARLSSRSSVLVESHVESHDGLDYTVQSFLRSF
jgi:hypothetical protein